MGWVHEDPDLPEVYDHEGFCVAVDPLAGGELPPIQVPLIHGEGTTPNSSWWLYNGEDGRPLATAVQAGCACGWRSREYFSIDWDDHEVTEGSEYGEGPWLAWSGHIREVVAGGGMPSTLSEALATIDRELLRLTTMRKPVAGEVLPEARPLVALAAIGHLEQLLQRQTPRAAARARWAGETWHAIGRALGISRQAAYQRFGKHSTGSYED
jgi:hypothetical protein